MQRIFATTLLVVAANTATAVDYGQLYESVDKQKAAELLVAAAKRNPENTSLLYQAARFVEGTDKGEFIGRDALVAAREKGPSRRLIGFEVEGRGIARDGHEVRVDGAVAGHVTSGTFSPTFERALGMAYVAAEHAEPGGKIEIDVRGRAVAARLRALPFYKRPKK